MCGIVGYIGKNECLPVLIDGLERLEYRGYDSAGIAISNGCKIYCAKSKGRVTELKKKISRKKCIGKLGIAHTRWATHGEPSEVNAHPHSGCEKKIWVVHNGIIENYQTLKNDLEIKGHKFLSQTDTEVIAHLIEELYDGDLTVAVKKACLHLNGAYAIVAIHADEPDKIVATKFSSPLVVGIGKEETIFSSDISAIVGRTKDVIYLNDGDIAEATKSGLKIINSDKNTVKHNVFSIDWNFDQVQKNGFEHFMKKEIFEQVDSIQNSIRGRLDLQKGIVRLGGLESVRDRLADIQNIIIVTCGTARHAGLVGEYMLEEFARIPTEVEYASEFRYRAPVLNNRTAVIAISQSGETADTLAAVREAKKYGALTIGIVNAVGSTIARETDAGVYNHIGPEVSVASTKAFTSQLVILALITVMLGRQRNLSSIEASNIVQEISQLSIKIEDVLKIDRQVRELADKYIDSQNFLFMGRKYNKPIAQEGALKMKEISYIHAEGIASGEMKHGTIALVDDKCPSLFVCPHDSVYEKNISNIEEIKARGGRVIAIATEGDLDIANLADDVIYVPKVLEMLSPIITVIPTQLLAYYMAVFKDRNVDMPRNLAKSVTVE
ncbi:glutamine--fructose-6-phosphate transaminase (isomerizing) [Patescibacteria group bacterium]|nr:glutamine--fructose-6-phosphate transaminase (isomerizing) [Patescibacteria group bacterium]